MPTIKAILSIGLSPKRSTSSLSPLLSGDRETRGLVGRQFKWQVRQFRLDEGVISDADNS